MAGLDKLRQRVARALDLVATHRPRDIEDYANRNRRVIVAKEGYLLRLFLIKYGESVLAQSGNIAPIGVRHCNGKRNQVGVGDNETLVEWVWSLLLAGRGGIGRCGLAGRFAGVFVGGFLRRLVLSTRTPWRIGNEKEGYQTGDGDNTKSASRR